MSKPEFTNERDLSASKKRRVIGRRLYTTDMDNLAYTYRNNEPTPVALMDYKKGHPASTINFRQSSVQVLKALANKTSLPFFVIITFQEHKVPMWFVIPSNQIARDKFKEWNMNLQGEWMSDLKYSLFHHALRDIEPDAEEIKSLNLSSETKEYLLPDIIGQDDDINQ